jgi:hypothetical protein
MIRTALIAPVLLLAACSATASRNTARATAPAATDALACVERSARARGFVSVSADLPDNQLRLERDVTGTLAEARRTWLQIDAMVDQSSTLRLFGERWERHMLDDSRGRKLPPGETIRSEISAIASACGGHSIAE